MPGQSFAGGAVLRLPYSLSLVDMREMRRCRDGRMAQSRRLFYCPAAGKSTLPLCDLVLRCASHNGSAEAFGWYSGCFVYLRSPPPLIPERFQAKGTLCRPACAHQEKTRYPEHKQLPPFLFCLTMQTNRTDRCERNKEFVKAREALLKGDIYEAQEAAGRMPTDSTGFVGSFEYAGEIRLQFGDSSVADGGVGDPTAAKGRGAAGEEARVEGYIRHLHLNNGTGTRNISSLSGFPVEWRHLNSDL